MKKARKGFTLIELLIVIAVIAALAATMGTSTHKATASAKAAAIVANIEACRTAAAMYYADNSNTNLSDKDASAFLKAESEYIPSWSDFGGTGIEGTTYSPVSGAEGQGYAKWAVTVDFSKDGDAAGIAKALNKIRGYSSITADTESEEGTTTTGTRSFTVKLSSGKVEVESSSGTGGGE